MSRGAVETPGYTAPSTHPFVPTRALDLLQPTTLATLPDGDLLILDSSRDQILKLTPRGALSVFAGDGRIGFSGDGGPARDAELDLTYFSSASIAVTPNGRVDFLDDGSCRIREVSPRGIIRTILRLPLARVYPSGTSCPINAFAVSPAGALYVATGSQVERVSRSGHLVWVAGARASSGYLHEQKHPTRANVALEPDAMAFNRAGDLYVASFAFKLIYELTPAGKLINLGVSYAHQLASGPDGEMLIGTQEGTIDEITATGIKPFYQVTPRRAGIGWGGARGFQEDGIAITRTGKVYVDNSQGNGWGLRSVLVQITPSRHVSLAAIRTPVAATLPPLGAPGFPASIYPAPRPSHTTLLAACPSDSGIEPFNTAAIRQARRVARTYLASQFASDIAATDRSWWTQAFNMVAAGDISQVVGSGVTLAA